MARQYYWHRFFSHQPDLNYDNPAVHQEMLDIMGFWLDRGIDGFRVDAVPYLYEREGTNCENLPETHDFLKKMREFVDTRYPGTLLLAEANQWPSDLLPYFGNGDEFHMAFNFPLMPRLFMALRREDSRPIIEIMNQMPEIPLSSQWALFLRNHDELTLEMVTDEERDYMYTEYAKDPRMRINLGIRRRLAPLMDNGRHQIELMHSLLFTLPGSPVLYYGDEIGMGDNVHLGDRNGVRTPMQWSGDRNAGFSRADPSALYQPLILDPVYNYQGVNVEAQLRSPSSLLNWLRRLIRVRRENMVFGRGSLEFLACHNRRVVAYVRRHQDEIALVVNNLSRFPQAIELDLSIYSGMTPVEMSGKAPFPAISDRPYQITLGPYGYYWLRLEKRSARESGFGDEVLDRFSVFGVGYWRNCRIQEPFQARGDHEGRHHHHQGGGPEEPRVEDLGCQADPREDQPHFAAGDHAHADDRLVAPEPERGVTGQELADDADRDQHDAGQQGKPARGLERIQGPELDRCSRPRRRRSGRGNGRGPAIPRSISWTRGTPARSRPPAKAPMIIAEPHRSASQAIERASTTAKTVMVPGSSMRCADAEEVRDEPPPHDGRHHEEADGTTGDGGDHRCRNVLTLREPLDDRQ